MAVIARQLGHSDTRMTERHYAHLAPNYVADTIRVNFPSLTEAQAPTVLPMERAGRNRRQTRLQNLSPRINWGSIALIR